MSSFRRSDPPTPPARPKLADALGRVADDPRDSPFSPRKQALASSPAQSPRQRLAAVATTKRPQRQHASPPVHRQPPVQAQEQLSDRSKSEGSSKFTKLARGLKPEIEKGRRDELAWAQSRQRNPFLDEAEPLQEERQAEPTPRSKRFQQPRAGPSSKVHLPDVTGLTSAVDTPVKIRMSYKAAPSPEKSQSSE